MNKRMHGIWIMVLSVFFVAPLFAVGEREEVDTRSANQATDQSGVKKKVNPGITSSSPVAASTISKNEQNTGKITAIKETGNLSAIKRPKLVAVQERSQRKEDSQSSVAQNVECKSVDVLSSSAKDKQQLQVRSLNKTVPMQKNMDISSDSKNKDIPRNEKSDAEIDRMDHEAQNDEGASSEEKKEAVKVERTLKAAMRYYRTCDFEAAEESVSRCLAVAPDNRAALTLKGKITAMREKMDEMQIDLAEQCYYRAESYKREGNILDAMLFAQKSLQLNPRLEKARVLSHALSESHEEIIKALQGADKVRFTEAVSDFLKEDFSGAANILRGLQPYCPQVTTMLAVAEIHSADRANTLRSRDYYASALDNIYNERYFKAQEDLYLALEMDKNNLDAKQKLLLVNHELGTQRISAVGQE